MNRNYKPTKLFIKGYNYNDWYENVESSDKEESVDLSDMSPLEGDEEEVKKRKRINKFNSKQIINKTSDLISTNKSRK